MRLTDVPALPRGVCHDADMPRIMIALVIAFIIPFALVAGVSRFIPMFGGVEVLIAYGLGLVAAAIYWRMSAPRSDDPGRSA